MLDLTPVLAVLLLNIKEAGVYFSLSCIGGSLVAGSCLLGSYLNTRLAPRYGPPVPPQLGSWSGRGRPSSLALSRQFTGPQGATLPWTGATH